MIFGTHDANTLKQFATIQKQSVASALMADGHMGYVMPVGAVAAYDNQVSVVGVGFDIACGNCAIKTDIKLADISTNRLTSDILLANPHKATSDPLLNTFADKIQKSISFGVGRTNLANDAPTDDPLFLDEAWYHIPNTGHFRDELREKARKQLGTVGSGNHYVDVFVDKADNHIWVGVHFGSRGLGHTIASNFLAIGQGGMWGDKGKEVETLLDLHSPIGQEYWALMELAGRYAYVGREWVARKVVSILGGKELDLVHNHHNFAWKETHVVNGKKQQLVVIRKGATPAFPGQRGFIGGSMGDDAVIITGSSNSSNMLQQTALYSTVHGAGRVMSRTEAAGKRNFRTGQLLKDKVTGKIINSGKVSPAMMSSWIKNFGTVLRGGGLDESPHVYRRLSDVLSAQQETITVTNVLRPVIVVMAGANEFDPYKD
ncbi:MAG: RtcB family protein [Verrucomicrobia bacterium]|nr:RtcB family protein [Verrucomicrobiota bacterium]